MRNTIIYIDNGHGLETPGKRSSDGRLVEAQWTRDIARRLQEALRDLQYDARLVVPEDTDISLPTRCNRVNTWIKSEPNRDHIFVSIHVNAAPAPSCDKEGWNDKASGWIVYVSENASEKSKALAQGLYAAAKKFHLEGDRSIPPEMYLKANFKVLRSTNCPAVLTESLFMTNHSEVEFLLSEKGRETIVNLHLLGILHYLGNPASVIVENH